MVGAGGEGGTYGKRIVVEILVLPIEFLPRQPPIGSIVQPMTRIVHGLRRNVLLLGV